MSSITENSKFEYNASGFNKDGNEVKFGGEAKTLGDAIGGVFGHDDVTVTDWNATQNVQYWTIVVRGTKGGNPVTERRFTFDDPAKSSAFVAGLAIGFDTVHSVQVVGNCMNRNTVDNLVEQNKENWI